jgi:hypothetical protein
VGLQRPSGAHRHFVARAGAAVISHYYRELDPVEQQDNSRDPAAAWVSRTPKQRAQAAARYDREARETLARLDAERTQKARASHVAKARLHVDAFSTLLLRGHKSNGTKLTREELVCARDCLKDAWKTLKRFDSEFVTVLS